LRHVRRPAIARFRALGLLAAVLVLAATALWSGPSGGDVAVSHHHLRSEFASPDQTVAVSTAAEAKASSGWIMPLAALGAALAMAFRYFARRDLRLVRASFPVSQRLVRACRRAPPRAVALYTF
jgi:H+/Cl- antiporter ClcA